MTAMDPADVVALLQSIWETQLGSTIEPGRVESPAEMIRGRVQIFGAWDGYVSLEMTSGLATGLAARMFSNPDVDEADTLDAVRELTNMIGGNLKGLVEGTSSLDIPTIESGGQADAPNVSIRLDLVSEGQPVRVSIFETDTLS